MHHALLIASQVVRQIGRARRGGLQQGLPDAGHVPVTEDAEAARDQTLLHAVPLAVLVGQKTHQRLRDGESNATHERVASFLGSMTERSRDDVMGQRFSRASLAGVETVSPKMSTLHQIPAT